MRLSAVLGSTALFVASALAIFADDAGHIDYHYALVGLPKQDATLFQQPFVGSKASLVYTLSDKLVIGAVNPKDGELVWRQALSSSVNSTEGYLRAGEDQDTVISAAGHAITAWTASDGRYVWSSEFLGSVVKDLEILELPDSKADKDSKDAVVLLSGQLQGVKRLDGKTGATRWTYEDTSGDSPFQVSSSATSIYYISLHSTLLGGIKIKVTSLDTLTGQKLDQYTLSSESDVSSSDSVLFAGANSASPLLAWTDKTKKTVKVNIIGTRSTTTISVPGKGTEDVVKITLHAPHRIDSRSHFLIQYDTTVSHSAEVYHVDLQKGSVNKAYTLPELPGKGAFTTSTSDANVYFTRITNDETIVVSSASHAVLGRWPSKKSPLIDNAYPVHGVSEVASRSGSAQAVRSAVLFSNGQWTLLRNGELVWARPELLADALTAVWAELPEGEALAHELAIEGHQNIVAAYVHRVSRHIRDLQHLPAWIQGLPAQIVANFAGKSSTPVLGKVAQDSFGFHKLIVVATSNNRLVALDAGSSGRVVWNTDAAESTLKDPVLSVANGYVAVKSRDQEFPVYINLTTGARLSHEAAITRQDATTVAAGLISYDLINGELKGFLGDAKPSDSIWGFAPSRGERIVGFTARPTEDPVASIGKVLGDRRVLYKYLNPNLVLVTTVVDLTRTASLYLLDSASGNILHAVSHSNIDTSRAIPSTISENWFSYSLTLDAATDDTSRGYQLVVAELYESALPNDRGPLGAASNSSSFEPSSAPGDAAKPYVISQTYQVPEEISDMTVTQTRQGITSRELLITLPESNSIVGIPRLVIDPRRPVGRDPTALEASEGLTKYNPALQFDPKWYLNHNLELVGIKDVIASPALLESTSLVFAYGLDIFGTRVAPSFAFDMLGKGFNKIQMLATVLALGVGVVFVAPLVQRKQINALWQIT